MPKETSRESDKIALELSVIIPQIMDTMAEVFDKIPPPDLTLSPSHLRILHRLAELGDSAKMNVLASRLGVTQGTLTTTTKKLIEKKYISRARSTEDDRVVIVTLTSKGKKLMHKNADNLKRIFSIVTANMSAANKQKLLESYRTIASILQTTLITPNEDNEK